MEINEGSEDEGEEMDEVNCVDLSRDKMIGLKDSISVGTYSYDARLDNLGFNKLVTDIWIRGDPDSSRGVSSRGDSSREGSSRGDFSREGPNRGEPSSIGSTRHLDNSVFNNTVAKL